MTVPTLAEDRTLAPQGQIRDEDGNIIAPGILEAYKLISERRESGFYELAKMKAQPAKPPMPLPTLDQQVQTVQPVLEAEKKIIPINESEEDLHGKSEQPFERGDIEFTPASKPKQPKQLQ